MTDNTKIHLGKILKAIEMRWISQKDETFIHFYGGGNPNNEIVGHLNIRLKNGKNDNIGYTIKLQKGEWHFEFGGNKYKIEEINIESKPQVMKLIDESNGEKIIYTRSF